MRFITLVCACVLTACGSNIDTDPSGSGGCHTGGASGSAASGGTGGTGGTTCPGPGLTGATCFDPACCGPTAADPSALCVQATGGEYPDPYFCADPASENKDGRACVHHGAQFSCLEWHTGSLELWCCSKAP